MKYTFYLLAAFFLTVESCAQEKSLSTFVNPVFSAYKSHDMALLRGRDGYIYAFGTCNVARTPNEHLVYYGVNIFRSKNLVNWDFYKRSHQYESAKEQNLEEKYPNAWKQGRFFLRQGDSIAHYPIWAPGVVEYKGKYLMFAALRKSFDDSKIVVFETDDLNRDFVFKRVVISTDERDGSAYVSSRETIDPFPIVDNGKLYLMYGSFARDINGKLNRARKGIGVFIVQLDSKTYAMKGQPTFLTDYYEGCSIQKHDGKYYLFGTNGTWTNHTYQLSYAESDRLNGPYRNADGTSIADTVQVHLGKVILRTPISDMRYNGFGCISAPIWDKKGRCWVLCNGHDLNLAPIVEKKASKERYAFLIELHWNEKGNPYFNIDAIESNVMRKPDI